MGLAEVKAAISSQTKQEAEAILSQAKAEAQRILSEAQAAVRTKREQHEHTTQELLEAMERREHAAAAFAKKTLLLEEKRKAIDAVYVQVKTDFASFDAQQRANILGKLAQKAKQEIDVQKVYCASQDVQVLSKLFPQASVMADKDMSGGLRAENAQGTVMVDLSFETMLENTRDGELEAMSKVLFG